MADLTQDLSPTAAYGRMSFDVFLMVCIPITDMHVQGKETQQHNHELSHLTSAFDSVTKAIKTLMALQESKVNLQLLHLEQIIIISRWRRPFGM